MSISVVEGNNMRNMSHLQAFVCTTLYTVKSGCLAYVPNGSKTGTCLLDNETGNLALCILLSNPPPNYDPLTSS